MVEKKKCTAGKMHAANSNLSAVEHEPQELEFRCPECGGNVLSWGIRTYTRAVIFENGYVDFHEDADLEEDRDQTEFGCCKCGLLICDGDEPIRTGEQLVAWIKANNTASDDTCNPGSADEPLSSPEQPVSRDSGQEESLLEIVERFKLQDFMKERIANLSRHLEGVASKSGDPTQRLVEVEDLLRILDEARERKIPDMLLQSRWELWRTHPEHVSEPPHVRTHSLSDAIRAFWEQGLEHELKNDLLYELEGEDQMEKLYVPQPRSEIETPANLYQLVRKALDQDRMDDLLAMIEADDDFLHGESRSEAKAV